MKQFINRDEELDFLEKEYSRKGSSLIIIYGRRRVGKTALTAEFLGANPGCTSLPQKKTKPKTKPLLGKSSRSLPVPNF